MQWNTSVICLILVCFKKKFNVDVNGCLKIVNIVQQYFVFKHHEHKSTKCHTRTKHTKTSKTQTQTKEIVLSHNNNLFDDDALHLLFFLNNISLSLTICLEYYGEDDLKTFQSHCFKKT